MASTRLPRPRLIDALAEVARAHPLERKLVVAPSTGGGRELIRRLGRDGKGWIGFEVITVRPLALKLAAAELDERGLQPVDSFEQQALVDEALDSVLASGAGELNELSEGVGFREAVHGTVDELRLAGLTAKDLGARRDGDGTRRRLLSRVLAAYRSLLEEHRRVDTADILRIAVTVLSREGAVGPALGADVVVLMPGLDLHGLRGRLVTELLDRGARVLSTDPVVGLEPPARLLWEASAPVSAHAWLHAPDGVPKRIRGERVELFRAASVTDELRAVLRRVIARELRWDEVEIVTADPATYGSALHALAARLGIPVTYAAGLPVERTRAGRVARTYLDWVADGFPADPIRRLLEAGDLRPPGRARHAPADLARRFRALRIGWGRHRCRIQIQHALAAVEADWQVASTSEGGVGRRLGRARGELRALRSILYPTLKATPSVPDRAGEDRGPVSPAELAAGLQAFMRRVPSGEGSDTAARDEILRVLERIRATLRRGTHFEAALAILRHHLDIRVKTIEPGVAGPDGGGAPRRSEGGYLHLTDVEHGAFSGRPAVFVVGMDTERVPGRFIQNPVLTDAERRLLAGDLVTTADKMRSGAFRFAAFFSRVRGSVTLSYGAWDASEARSVAPSPVLLQALRLALRDPAVGFRELHEVLGSVACAVPDESLPALDADDVWMGRLGAGGVLRKGVDAVRVAYPRLDAGLSAAAERRAGMPGPHHGVVAPRPDRLDPRHNPELVVSASRLEALGACPLRYFFQNVLHAVPPDDPELDPDRWLDPLRRGSLLHAVYEGSLRNARREKVEYDDVAFERLALDVLAEEVRTARERVPTPGEGVLRRDVARLEEDVRSFVRMVRSRGAPWVALELRFGLGDDEPLLLDVPGGRLRLRGAVDRIDDGLDGLTVIDYKTGAVRGYESGTGTFNGGRRLQHALYAVAAEERLGGNVLAGEYHFPTRRGENAVRSYGRRLLAGVAPLLGHILDGVAAGAFVPTDNQEDCRFCDYAEICRVSSNEWGKVRSPPAEWSRELCDGDVSPAFAHLRKVRDFEGRD